MTQRIRIIVVHQLPQAEQNALLCLFSTRLEQVRYGKEHYQPRTTELTTLFYDLFKTYSEDPAMSKELQDYARERIKELLKDLPPEERLEGVPVEELRKRLSAVERLEGLSAEERLEGLSPKERLEGLTPEELRAALEELQRRLQGNGPSAKPQ